MLMRLEIIWLLLTSQAVRIEGSYIIIQTSEFMTSYTEMTFCYSLAIGGLTYTHAALWRSL